MGNLKEKLKALIQEKSYKTKENYTIVSTKGCKSTWLLDLRQILFHQEALDIITELFWKEMAQYLPFQVAGMEFCGCPLTTAIVLKGKQLGYETSGFVIRKERKNYGMCQLLEGEINDLPIVLVDDTTNSGKSFKKMYEALGKYKQQTHYFFTIVDFQNPQGKEPLNACKVGHKNIFLLEEFGLNFHHGEEMSPEPIGNVLALQSLPNANYYFDTPRDSLKVYKNKILFLADNYSLYTVDYDEKIKITSFFDSNVLFPEMQNANISLIGNNAYFLLNSCLLSVSLKTQKIEWKFLLSSLQGKIQIDENYICFVDHEHKDLFILKVFDRKTGALLFDQNSEKEMQCILYDLQLYVLSGSQIKILELPYGGVKKSIAIPEESKVLAIEGDEIFIVSDEMLLQSYSKTSGEKLWEEKVPIVSSFFVNKDIIVIGASSAVLKICNRKTKKLLHRLKFPETIISHCFQSDKYLYVFSKYQVYQVEKQKGKISLVFMHVEKIQSLSLIKNDRLLIHSAGNSLAYVQL